MQVYFGIQLLFRTIATPNFGVSLQSTNVPKLQSVRHILLDTIEWSTKQIWL